MAVAVRTELLARRNASGKIVPSEVVEWARDNEGSQLHSELEWDDEVAGERWRVEQVRRLIAIHIVDAEGSRQTISLSIDRRDGGYRMMDDVRQSPNLREIMLADALLEFQRMEARYNKVQELNRVWGEVSIVRETQQGSRRRRAA